MRYIMLEDFENAEEMDDGLYLVRVRNLDESSDSDVLMEPFSESDLYKIKKRKPEDADSMAYTDDWMFYNKAQGMLFNYVFQD